MVCALCVAADMLCTWTVDGSSFTHPDPSVRGVPCNFPQCVKCVWVCFGCRSLHGSVCVCGCECVCSATFWFGGINTLGVGGSGAAACSTDFGPSVVKWQCCGLCVVAFLASHDYLSYKHLVSIMLKLLSWHSRHAVYVAYQLGP